MRRRTISALFAVMAWLTAWSGLALAQDRNAPPPPPGTSSGAGFEYRLGAGDKLRIIVFGEESLTGEFFVSGGGKVAFPLIGDIDVVGLTIPELQAAIAAKLADGYLKQPRVSAEVLNYRPFYILGEVMKPGEYPYTNGLTVLNAVATAQGFTYRADTHKVFIKRAATSSEVQSALTPATPVLPGDTIRIGERFF
jgi:protein involved in polysaccharide export with SLBB domain